MKIFDRDPAVFYALVASFIQLVSAVAFDLSMLQQGALNGAVVAVAGCVLAWKVAAEKGIALLSGVATALAAVALAFGASLSPEIQSSALLFLNMAVAFWVRGQVSAPIDINGNEVPKELDLILGHGSRDGA